MLKEVEQMRRKGTALLVVLFIIIAATIISLGFLSRSDIELACGKNMVIRTQMDYLAESGLEHARGMILNPQDIESEYWTGTEDQQLAEGFADYYDVEVVKLQERNYQINCQAYHFTNGLKQGQSSLEAQLRLYPCIGLWTSDNTSLSGNVTINGDVYCQGTFLSSGVVNGDAFVGVLNASVTGKQRSADGLSLDWPSLEAADYTSRYPVVTIDVNSIANTSLGPYEPAKVCYREGDLSIDGVVHVNGLLIVDGSLTINGLDNVFVSQKNLPALLVTGNLNIENASEADITGLAIVYGEIQVNGQINVLGSMFSQGGISGDGTLNVNASGSKASIVVWPDESLVKNWSPSAGAVYRSIDRR
jgi:cytoskeletal protein CcmA (bactofilin family)